MITFRNLAIAATAAMSLALAQLPANAQQTLYGVTGAGATASTLYTIDPATGMATQVGTGIGFNEVVSIDFDPVSSLLYGISNSGSADASTLITIDTGTGVGTAVMNGTDVVHVTGIKAPLLIQVLKLSIVSNQ